MGKRTLGGDRLGSGNRMKQELHNYFRSNHNLSCARISSMAPGVLYPMYVNQVLTGDTFDIDLSAFVRTLPTEGPMFGAFKLQVDVFTADARLYQAILHNNTTDIGMDMDKVYFPKVQIQTKSDWVLNEQTGKYEWKQQINKSSLMYYLGLAGLGRSMDGDAGTVTRKLNANPMLAYYDIFKNYYANKQEENAYVIANNPEYTIEVLNKSIIGNVFGAKTPSGTPSSLTSAYVEIVNTATPANASNQYQRITIAGQNLTYKGQLAFEMNAVIENAKDPNNTAYWQVISSSSSSVVLQAYNAVTLQAPYVKSKEITASETISTEGLKLQPFPLKNIDTMRKNLLTQWDLGEEYVIDDRYPDLPYNCITQLSEDGYTKNINPMQGLVVKCYQSDMFNNWLDSEWVAKVSEYSRVNVQSGSFSMDALNLAKKMYNHYNRVAISGGTYDDWQLAAYGEENYGKTEKPVYHGGMSAEVIFDEVVSSVATANEPLGSLGGRGSLKGNRGGHCIIKCKEAGTLMVIVSLTPRVAFTEGNSWYLTELVSMDDLHKPEFDRIGFQDLIAERMAWWDSEVSDDGVDMSRSSVGKQPAWIEYMTDVDKCYGDFAEPNGKGFMVLQRMYDTDQETRGVADITTYIDPSKYNYAFANASLTAQNFWTFLNLNIKARRKMSAKQIPNF